MYMEENELSAEEWLNRYRWILPEEQYVVNEHGEFCQVLGDQWIPIANFFLIPLEKVQIVSEDGKAKTYKYVFTCVVRKEMVLDKVEILASDLHSPTWIKKWGHYCQIYDKVKLNYQVILDFLFETEKVIPTWIEYDTIGWHYYNNKWFYLHSGGIIGESESNIRTNKTNFSLKKDVELSSKEAFLGSLDMLEICDRKLTYSLLSYVLTSIIATPLISSKQLSPNYVLWVMGGTGYGKTTFTTLFTNIFDATNMARPEAHKTAVILPGLQEHKDCVFIIDDFGTSKTKQSEYVVINKVEDMIRKLTDRQYSTEKGSISKGMLLINGERFMEQNEQNTSSIRRTIRVKMDNVFNPEEGTHDNRKLERYNYHKDKMFLPTSIGYYLEWLSEKLNFNFMEDYNKDFEALRQEMRESYGNHGRYSDGFAHQIIAFNFYMAYGKEKGFITPEQCIQKCNMAKEIFLNLLNDQSETIFDQNVELFLKGLNQLIADGRIVIKKIIRRPMLNFDQRNYGVVTVEKNQEVLKLDWENVYQLVSKHIMDSQQHRNSFVGAKKLAKLLDEYNLLCFNENGSTTPLTAWNNNQTERCRVINFRTDMIPEIMASIHELNAEYSRVIDELAQANARQEYQLYLDEYDEREANEYDDDDTDEDIQEEIENHEDREPYIFTEVFRKRADA